MPIQVVIADDHALFREGFVSAFRKEASIEIVAQVGYGNALIDAVEKLEPDLVVTDVKMPLLNGIEACRLITKNYPHLPVLALTAYNEDGLIEDLLEAGAAGILHKEVGAAELLRAMKSVIEGGSYFSPDMLGRIRAMASQAKQPLKNIPLISERERMVLTYLFDGMSAKQIAGKMGISIRTVEGHKAHLQEKVGVDSLAGLIKFAVRAKICSL